MTRPAHEDSRLKSLLQKYEIARPVPHEVQRHFSSRMGSIFTRILKAAGLYTFASGATAYFYFALKKLGIIITTKYFILFAATVALTGGGALTYLYFRTAEVVTHHAEISERVATEAARKGTAAQQTNITYTMGIMPFVSSSLDRATAEKAAHCLESELTRIRGREYATVMDKQDDAVKYSLTGSIEKVDEAMLLFVRIVDTKSSAIVFVCREKFGALDDLSEICRRVSSKIAASAK